MSNLDSNDIGDNIGDDIRDVLDYSFNNDRSAYKQCIKPEFVTSLKEIQLDKPESCIICLDDDNKITTCYDLECKHLFHTDCIQIWFKDHSTCPTCRHQFPSQDIREEITEEIREDISRHYNSDTYDTAIQRLRSYTSILSRLIHGYYSTRIDFDDHTNNQFSFPLVRSIPVYRYMYVPNITSTVIPNIPDLYSVPTYTSYYSPSVLSSSMSINPPVFHVFNPPVFNLSMPNYRSNMIPSRTGTRLFQESEIELPAVKLSSSHHRIRSRARTIKKRVEIKPVSLNRTETNNRKYIKQNNKRATREIPKVNRRRFRNTVQPRPGF